MCGIAGIYNSQSKPFAIEERLLRMQNAIGHRGPDDTGSFLAEDHGIGLAHSRLSIIDLSPAGHQPMATPDGRYWIVFNGEIYNFLSLRQKLEQEGETFVSHSDTEVILKLYARHGADCVKWLRGMFAFAIWDAQRKELFLTRDRLGIKPLYYHAGANLFVFASEVRAILASGLVKRQVDHFALSDYLTYQSIP